MGAFAQSDLPWSSDLRTPRDPMAMGMEVPLDGTHIRKVNHPIPQRRREKRRQKSMNPWHTAPESFQG